MNNIKKQKNKNKKGLVPGKKGSISGEDIDRSLMSRF